MAKSCVYFERVLMSSLVNGHTIEMCGQLPWKMRWSGKNTFHQFRVIMRFEPWPEVLKMLQTGSHHHIWLRNLLVLYNFNFFNLLHSYCVLILLNEHVVIFATMLFTSGTCGLGEGGYGPMNRQTREPCHSEQKLLLLWYMIKNTGTLLHNHMVPHIINYIDKPNAKRINHHTCDNLSSPTP